MLFALAQQQKFAQMDLLCKDVERLFADHGGTELRQLALRQIGIFPEQKFRNHDGQHAVSQKFQALVALAGLTLFVGIGRVRQCLQQQMFILKMIADIAFKLRQVHVFCMLHDLLLSSVFLLG